MAMEKAFANLTELPEFADQVSVRISVDMVFRKGESTEHIFDESQLASVVRTVLADAALDGQLFPDKPLVRIVVTSEDGRIPAGMKVSSADRIYKLYVHS